jgi:hypothetical protein
MNRVVARNRRIPGRADGYLQLTFRWPSGEFHHSSDYCRHRLDPIFAAFRDRLRMIPPEELSHASCRVWATVRKAAGGRKLVLLASWTGSGPVEAFFASARAAWLTLPKESDDEGGLVPIDEADFLRRV